MKYELDRVLYCINHLATAKDNWWWIIFLSTSSSQAHEYPCRTCWTYWSARNQFSFKLHNHTMRTQYFLFFVVFRFPNILFTLYMLYTVIRLAFNPIPAIIVPHSFMTMKYKHSAYLNGSCCQRCRYNTQRSRGGGKKIFKSLGSEQKAQNK